MVLPKASRPPRVDILLRVEFESVGQLRADFLSNLSAGGMFVRTNVPFVVGQVLSLQISLPGVIEPTIVEGEVRWLTSEQPEFLRGVGLAFRSLPAALRQRLETTVHQMAGAPEAAVEPGGTRDVSVALLVANPILQEIIRGELERLARGGAGYRASKLALHTVLDPAACAALLAHEQVDVVVADCDGLGVRCDDLVNTLRGPPRSLPIAVVVLQGPEGQLTAPPNDSRTIVLRKPVGMKALYTTLLALASIRKAH